MGSNASDQMTQNAPYRRERRRDRPSLRNLLIFYFQAIKCYVPNYHLGHVLPEDGRWCLNYTMESELFLGKSADCQVIGCIDDLSEDESEIQ